MEFKNNYPEDRKRAQVLVVVQFGLWWPCGTAAPGCVGFKKHRRGRLCHTGPATPNAGVNGAPTARPR